MRNSRAMYFHRKLTSVYFYSIALGTGCRSLMASSTYGGKMSSHPLVIASFSLLSLRLLRVRKRTLGLSIECLCSLGGGGLGEGGCGGCRG